MQTIVKVLAVVDTREYIEDGDRWIPVSGTGDQHECARCGRIHEVHAVVEISDGSTEVVGTGCMGGESLELKSRLRSMGERAKRIARLEAELIKAVSLAVEAEAKEKAIDALPEPELIHGVKTLGGVEVPTVSCGGEELYCRFGNRDEEARAFWRSGLYGYPRAHNLRDRVERIKKSLATLKEK